MLVASGTYTGGGNKDLDFGGVYLVPLAEAGPVLERRSVSGNSTTDYYWVGAVYCESSSPTLTDCIITANDAESTFDPYWRSCPRPRSRRYRAPTAGCFHGPRRQHVLLTPRILSLSLHFR
ncbi:MAG: hypothetical protein CME06_08850 [Gemmatimonadetes bacterium]|nr:hypothetical protein [Gemmatimonadota bacterium]